MRVGSALLRAASHSDPVRALMDAYAGQALPKKLGIKTGMRIALVNAPPGLANNWVDYKICAIDQTWSGLLFARRVR